MPVIDDVTFGILEKEFAKMGKGVHIDILTGSNCHLCDSLREFGRKIALASKGKISVDEKRVTEMYPGVNVLENLKYAGFPMGKQMWVLLNFLVDLSNGRDIMEKEMISEIMNIDKRVNIDVFVTANCEYSPLQVRLAYEMAALNKNIRVRVIDGTFFPDLVIRHDISATPMTVINNKVRIRGSAMPDEFLRKIKSGLE